MSAYYLIRESLTPCRLDDIRRGGAQYVAVLTADEWQKQQDTFDMMIDMDMDAPRETRAVVNMDSLTGALSIPDRADIGGARRGFRLRRPRPRRGRSTTCPSRG